MSAPLPIAIGEDNFRILRERDSYFVDKSPLIEEIANTRTRVSLITRPRRMGKTLNLSMLHYFFSCTEPDTAPLYEGLSVKKNPEVMALQGKFPVIFLTLKGIRGQDWETSQEQLRSDIARLCGQFLELGNSNKVPDHLKKGLQAILNREKNGPFEDVLFVLMEALHAHHGERAILLIDEYDAPIQRAYQHGFYPKMAAFMQRFLDVLKTSPHLHQAVLTGCLRISKESLFSTLNNFDVYTVQQSSPYDGHFGFTQDEVDQILTDAGMSAQNDTVRQWYNGYLFGKTTIYNPWSILKFVHDGGDQPRPYWLNTSENSLLHQRLEEARLGLQDDLETLLQGDAIEREVKDSITFKELGKVKEDVWSILVHTGYLNAEFIEDGATDSGHFCRLTIPNFEVSQAFASFTKYLIPEFDFQLQRSIFNALRDGETEKLAAGLTELTQFLSYHDKVANQPEAAFHAFVLGLLAIGRSIYAIRSNPETGSGRADITMRPRTKENPGVIIEFKSLKAGEDIENALTEALKQVKTKNYDWTLKEAGVEQIKRYAVVLREKSVTAQMA